jgi:hypothetical protein
VADAAIVRRPDALAVESASARVTVTPALLASQQPETDEPISLEAPAAIALAVDPFTVPGGGATPYDFGAADLSATLTSEPLRVVHPALEETVVVEDLRTTLATTPAGETSGVRYAIDGGADVRGRSAVLARLVIDLDGATGGDTNLPTGFVKLTDLDVAGFERAAGLAAQALTGWVGSGGNVSLVLDGTTASEATLTFDMPRLTGTATAAVSADEVLTATAENMRLVVAASTLERMLNPPTEDGETGSERMRVLEDVTCGLELEACRMPLAMFRGEAFDPATVDLDVALSGGPVTIADAAGGPTRLDAVKLTLASDDLASGIAFTLDGSVPGAAAGKKGTIDVGGTVTGLVGEDRTLATEAATLDMTAEAAGVPTAIADGLFGFDGLLVAALGLEMSATSASKNFAHNSGYLDLEFKTDNGLLTGRLRVRNGAIRTTKVKPLHAELAITPPLRDRLLSKIHPVLADIETARERMAVDFETSTYVPLDGDVSRLRSDFTIKVGEVTFRSGAATLGILAFFNTGRPEMPGEIEPIVVRIRKGIVTYERFAVRIDKYTLLWEGSVDLVKQTVDLRTEIPLEGLAMSIKELRGYADEIIVPLVTRGPIDDPTTEIDPDFDLAGAAIKAGVGGILEDQGLGGLEDVLGDIFGGKKDPEKDDE